MNENQFLLLQIAAFLKITFRDKLIGMEQATREAAELEDKIGKAILADQDEV